MLKLPANHILAASLLLLAPLTTQSLQAQASAKTAPNYIRVNAPLAQSIVDKVFARHSGEIGKLGIHAVPPGSNDNVIIANSIRSKNGKKSSAKDLQKLATGKPQADRVDKEHIFDLLIPMTDAHGGDLNGGFVVMEVPFTKTNNEEEALKIGIAIRNEIQKQIPSKDALYR